MMVQTCKYSMAATHGRTASAHARGCLSLPMEFEIQSYLNRLRTAYGIGLTDGCKFPGMIVHEGTLWLHKRNNNSFMWMFW